MFHKNMKVWDNMTVSIWWQKFEKLPSMTEDLTFADTRKSSYSFSSSWDFSPVSPGDVCVDRKYSPLSCNQSMACVESTFKKMQKPFHVFIYNLIFLYF